MRSTLIVLFVLAASARAGRASQGLDDQNCRTCHGEQVRLGQGGIHAPSGVGCIACHGGVGGALEAEAAHGTDLRSLRDPRAAVDACGGCHSDVERMRAFGVRTDQLSLYWTSRHGILLATDGDTGVATCVSCHGSHGIVQAGDPLSPVHPRNQGATCGHCHADAEHMARYGLPTNQVELYRDSVHGQALIVNESRAAPACADCHGSHGAQPPRSADVETVCGQCHSTEQRYYDESPHAKAGQASIACISCHGNHGVSNPSSAMFLGDDEYHCGSCHSDAADPALEVARRLHDDVELLASTIQEAEDAIAAAALKGLFLGEETGYLEEARGLLVRARTMTHTLSPLQLDEVLNRGKGMVGTTLDSLKTKGVAFRDRRIFTTLFFVVTIAFALVLALYSREISGRWKKGDGDSEEERRA